MLTVAERLRTRPSAQPLEPRTKPPRRERIAYLDNLKLLLVAAIIAAHGLAGYSDLESAWPYQDVQETQLGAVSNMTLGIVVLPAVLSVMGLFFLISGLVTPGSVSRKGPRRFARDRLIRLGVPLLIWTLLIWPAAKWASELAAGRTEPFWSQITQTDPLLDTGPMWFVEVLLVYSLVYAGWRSWRRRHADDNEPVSPSTRRQVLSEWTLVALAVAISVCTVLIRPVLPILSGQPGQSHLWQWPQFVAMFGLGIVAVQRGWLDPVSRRIRRECTLAALGSLAVFLIVVAIILVGGLDGDVIFDPGPSWISLSLAALEGPLALGVSVWILAFAQQRLDRHPGPLGRAMTRSAYAAFVLQGVVLIGLMVALRPIPVPAEIKAVTVACLGVAGSFSLAWLLVTRTRVGRVL